MKNEINCPNCGTMIPINESDFNAIVKQVRDQEFLKELQQKEKEWEIKKAQEIMLANANAQSARQAALMEKERQITELKAKISNAELQRELAVSKATAETEREREQLKSRLDAALLERKNAENEMREQHERALKEKDEVIAHYKDFKARLSTKLNGESLEQHCKIEFDKIRTLAFPNAYFEKDNEISESGSKGDYIYREIDASGAEILSIMFEMKNEEDKTATKKRNEDFFKELDKDRKEKHCEYAVLVSMLEPDNELYTGITDVYKYEKMYVVRPQFFIPIITLLRNAAMKSLSDRRELAIIKSKETDVSKFEENLDEYKDGINRLHKLAQERFQDAISKIDTTIKNLEAVKEELLKSEKHFKAASNKGEELTIKRLTREFPAVKTMFELNEGKTKNKESGETDRSDCNGEKQNA